MFNVNDKIVDPRTDDIGLLLNKILEIPTYTKVKRQLHKNLIEILEKRGYLSFVGHSSRYHLSRIGESCLYNVPLNRRGYLKKFRGKQIRLVCVHSGRFDRLLMANSIS